MGSLSRFWSHLRVWPTWNRTELEALGSGRGGPGVPPRDPVSSATQWPPGWNILPAQRDSRKTTALCVQKALFLPKRTAVCYND